MALEKLLPASFRGIAFETTTGSIEVGRRVQVFEYPQRDIPFVEDLGRSARKLVMKAICAGPGYTQRMKSLLAAMEEKGPGILVHPVFGNMTVIPEKVTKFSLAFNKQGFAEAELSFVESGEYKFPSSTTDTKSLIEQLKETIRETALAKFLGEFDISAAQDFVRAAVAGKLSDYFNLERLKSVAALFGMSDSLADTASKALTLVNSDPAVLAATVADAFGFSRAAYSVNKWRRVTRQLSSLARGDELNVKASSSATQTQKEISVATSSLQSYVRELAVSEMVSAAASVGTEDDEDGELAYEELMSVRDDVLATLDAEMEKAGDDELYKALSEARAAIWEDMTTRAERLARLVEYTPAEVEPAIVLAYDYYEDTERESEIVTRNNLAHSGFAGASPLKLLSE